MKLVNAEKIDENGVITFKVYLPEDEKVYFSDYTLKNAKRKCVTYLKERGYKLNTISSFSFSC
jgi:hypothetical protein